MNKTVKTPEQKSHNQHPNNDTIVISVIDQPKNKDGYMKLEVKVNTNQANQCIKTSISGNTISHWITSRSQQR